MWPFDPTNVSNLCAFVCSESLRLRLCATGATLWHDTRSFMYQSLVIKRLTTSYAIAEGMVAFVLLFDSFLYEVRLRYMTVSVVVSSP